MLRHRSTVHDRRKAKATEYATRRDFQKIFTEEMAGLHLLAFLLTTNQAQAEQCFVTGLEDTIQGNAVFQEWARSWSKRAIIKNAIKALAPAPGQPGHAAEAGTMYSDRGDGNPLVAAVTQLQPFDRFVLVMAVLEGYSVRECSALLGRPVREVVAAKSHALERLAALPSAAAQSAGSREVSWASFLAPTQLA